MLLESFFVVFAAAPCGAATAVPQAPPFGPPVVLTAEFTVGADVSAGDLNGDGVPDLVQANPGLSYGINRVAFRAKLLEDDGAELATIRGAAPVGPFSLSCAAGIATADFDEDGLDDIAAITYGLGVNVALNGGQSQAVSGFASCALVDDLNRFFTYSWPVMLRVPVFLARDFDQDGHQDLLIAPVLIDFWAQHMSTPGMFAFHGRGDGTFDPAVHAPLASTPIDADWIDWDGDRRCETLLFLGQQVPDPTATHTYVARFGWQGRTPQLLEAPQQISHVAHPAAIVHVPASPATSGNSLYFVSGHGFPNNTTMLPELCVAEVDPGGRIVSAQPFALPAAIAAGPLGDLVSVQAADFDRDGATDLVALHARGSRQPGELLWILGPLDQFGSNGGIHATGLGGTCVETRNGPAVSSPGSLPVWMPNLTAAQSLAVVDLDLDQLPDLMVGGLIVPAATLVMAAATLQNLAQPAAAAPRGHVVRVGPARTSPAGNDARCGTAGGLPVLGNSRFAITLGNGPRDAVVSLMAGSPSMPFHYAVLPAATVPLVFSDLRRLQAPLEGGSRASFALPIPADPAVLGVFARFQWLIHDLHSSDPWPIYCSDTIEVQVGQRL